MHVETVVTCVAYIAGCVSGFAFAKGWNAIGVAAPMIGGPVCAFLLFIWR